MPMDGISAESIRNNAWQIKQLLAAGIHGLLLVNAETPEAVRAFVSACRYAFAPATPRSTMAAAATAG